MTRPPLASALLLPVLVLGACAMPAGMNDKCEWPADMAIALMVLGHLWDGVVEMIRVGNTHMSYRPGRLGWREHSEEVFAIAVLRFWLMVVAAYRLHWLTRPDTSAGAVK